MNYEQFRTAWNEVLTGAGMQFFPPTETVDLSQMSRTYRTTVFLGSTQQVRPFFVTATLSWTWDALQSARTATVEEDLLMQLLGEERRQEDTEQPWLRIDATLRATLPRDAPLPLPETAIWHRWVVDVMARLSPLLPTETDDDEHERLVLAWCGEPEARVRCAPDGRLHLSRVEVLAWQGIDLPRQWDDPERAWFGDEAPDDQLIGFVERVWKAMREWNQSLAHLLP